MGFEGIKNVYRKEETVSLYPERAFLRVDGEIARLKKIESGEIPRLELTDAEREEVLRFEDGLGEELEKIYDIKINSSMFYPEYFLSDEGREDFLNVAGIEMVGETGEEISTFLFKNRSLFDSLDGKKLLGLTGRSRDFSDKKVVESINETMDEEGNISVEGLSNPERVKIILNPGEAFNKIQKLRQFKRGLPSKKQNEEIAEDNISIAKRKIETLYRKKVNSMIVGQSSSGIWARQLEEYVGDENLTEEERGLKNSVPGLIQFEEILSRYDRVIHGADSEFDENGMRRQIGSELLNHADKLEKRGLINSLEKEIRIREKGLDPEKIMEKTITAEEFSNWANKMLELYGEKSSLPAEEYDPKRKRSAPDNKWQFLARKEYKLMAVDSKQKVIKSGAENKAIVETLSTLLGHELTHFVQAINQSEIPLHLFNEKLGGFRAGVFAEGGAMEIESTVCKELFGFEITPHPHYIRAMAKKIEGGTYLDCVKAFYDSGIKNIRKKKEAGRLDDERFKEEAKELLKLAVNRAKRLFSGVSGLGKADSYLISSSDTAYAEQLIVMEKLKENGLENCAFVKGINLDTLATLTEMGLVDLNKIKKPNLDLIREIWEQEKHKYVLA